MSWPREGIDASRDSYTLKWTLHACRNLYKYDSINNNFETLLVRLNRQLSVVLKKIFRVVFASSLYVINLSNSLYIYIIIISNYNLYLFNILFLYNNFSKEEERYNNSLFSFYFIKIQKFFVLILAHRANQKFK